MESFNNQSFVLVMTHQKGNVEYLRAMHGVVIASYVIVFIKI